MPLGGSLTATEPPDRYYYCAVENPFTRGGTMCLNPNHDHGSPRGVTPALDADTIVRIMDLSLEAPGDDQYGDDQYAVAEWILARLGSPEDSDATN